VKKNYRFSIIEMTCNIVNGWEFLNDINPINMHNLNNNVQNDYMQNYNLAYHNFINSLCLTVEELKNIKNEYKIQNSGKSITKHRIIIDLEGESDIINSNMDYNIKFLKSKFLTFKTKKIKTDLINHYKPLGFYVSGPNELINNKTINQYYIELFWNL